MVVPYFHSDSDRTGTFASITGATTILPDGDVDALSRSEPYSRLPVMDQNPHLNESGKAYAQVVDLTNGVRTSSARGISEAKKHPEIIVLSDDEDETEKLQSSAPGPSALLRAVAPIRKIRRPSPQLFFTDRSRAPPPTLSDTLPRSSTNPSPDPIVRGVRVPAHGAPKTYRHVPGVVHEHNSRIPRQNLWYERSRLQDVALDVQTFPNHMLTPNNRNRVGTSPAMLPVRNSNSSAIQAATKSPPLPGQEFNTHSSATASVISEVPKTVTCNNCLHFDLACDGEQPCSRCSAFSATCYFEKPKSRLTLKFRNVAQVVGQVTEPELESKGPTPAAGGSILTDNPAARDSHGHQESTNPALIAARGASEFGREYVNGLTQLSSSDLPTNSGLLPEELQDSSFPMSISEARLRDRIGHSADETNRVLDVDTIMRIMRSIQAEVQLHREQTVGGLLRGARMYHVEKAIAGTRSTGINPFDALLAQPPRTPHHHLQIKTKAHGLNRLDASFSKPENMPVAVFKISTQTIPRYKSIARVGPGLLSRNMKTFRYLPYFPDNENLDDPHQKQVEEMEERYKTQIPQLNDQRKCREISDIWRPWLEMVLDFLGISPLDVASCLSSSERSLSETLQVNFCPTCHPQGNRPNSPAAELLMQGRREVIKHLDVATQSLADVCLWHILVLSEGLKQTLIQRSQGKSIKIASSKEALCLVCFRHFCTSHGAFLEPEEEDSEIPDARVDDFAADVNARLYVGFESTQRSPTEHLCGVYCGSPNWPVRSLLGRQDSGKISGQSFCPSLVDDVETFKDGETCSTGCSWDVKNRNSELHFIKDVEIERLPAIEDTQAEKLKAMIPLFVSHKRGACMLSMAIPGLSCKDVFYHMIAVMNAAPHNDNQDRAATTQFKPKSRPNFPKYEVSRTSQLDMRSPFVPCSHEGPCDAQKGCSCAEEKIVCEWSCNCSLDCRRRYEGCSCRSNGGTACSGDKNCECRFLNRECDPHLCGSCGVTEVLDPSNRYSDDVRKNRCANNRLQLQLPKRTLKGPSEVHGWGLFAGEDIERGDFLGEYKGEIVSTQESDRRGGVYHNIELEYLFIINRDQQIDGTNIGNKMRLLNNSEKDEYINVQARKMLCGGVQRVMLYATKTIAAGEELLYRYGYPDDVTVKFWEKDDTAETIRAKKEKKGEALTKAISKLKQSKTSDTKPELNAIASQSNQSPVASKKRKRISARDDDDTLEPALPLAGRDVQSSPSAGKAVADSDESDFDASKLSSNDSEAEEMDTTSEEDTDDVSGLTTTPSGRRGGTARLRKIHATDGRLGGAAQKRAWRTRHAMLQRKK